MSEPQGPDDDALGRLLAEGLGRSAAGPVDDRELLAGARRGAARIRRRRRTVLTVASILVIGSPVGLAVSESMRPTRSVTSASSAGAPPSASDVAAPGPTPDVLVGGPPPAAGAESRVGSQRKATGSRLPGAALPGSALPGAAPAVPADALLTTVDLPAASLRPVSDTSYPGPVPATSTADTCGVALPAAPGAAYGRASVLERPAGATGDRWLLGSTVRVFAGGGAQQYTAAASRLGCVTGVVVHGAEQAVLGQGRPDAAGRVHWYAVARGGRGVTEVRRVVPSGSGIVRADVVRLVVAAATRATSSGLVPSAAADPALA